MMKVKMLTVSAGPKGVLRPGDTVEVSESEGALLIAGKYAEPVGEKAPPAPKPTEPEAATEPTAPEASPKPETPKPKSPKTQKKKGTEEK